MPPAQVVAVLDVLQARELQVWLDGGWGVDALLGEMTRQHEDVDLVVQLEALVDVIDTLGSLGFRVEEDYSPTRVVLRSSDGRQIDLHPVTFAEDGTGWQLGAAPNGDDCPYPSSGFGRGLILDRVVPCLSAELTLAHHLGYEPRDRDRSDMAILAKRFNLSLPSPY